MEQSGENLVSIRKVVTPVEGNNGVGKATRVELIINFEEDAPLGYYTAAFRLSWPLLSAAASIVMLFVAGFLIGRSSVRAELYATRCFLAMPLFGVVSCGVLLSSDYLTQSLTLLLLALASRNYYNSFHRHYCFDRMFRGSLYVGLIPLLYAPGAGLLLLIPLVVLLFRRTLREAVVALSGAILPLFFAGFIHWAAGGRFDGPVRQVAAAITSDSGYRFFDGNTLFSLIAWGVIFFLLICSAAGVLLDIRTLKTKPRNILFLQFIRLVRRGRHLFCTVFFTDYTDPCGTGRSYAHPRRADQIQQCGRIDVLYGSYFTEPRSRPDIETRKVSIVANMDFCIVWRYICTITHCIIQCFIIHLSCKHMESLF